MTKHHCLAASAPASGLSGSFWSRLSPGTNGMNFALYHLLVSAEEVARHAGGPNQRPSPPIPSPRAGRGEITHKSCILQPLLGLISSSVFSNSFLKVGSRGPEVGQ